MISLYSVAKPYLLNAFNMAPAIAHSVESILVKLHRDMPVPLEQSAQPANTSGPIVSYSPNPFATSPHTLTTHKESPYARSTPSYLPPSHFNRTLMSVPKAKSKLSIVSATSYDTGVCYMASSCSSTESSDDESDHSTRKIHRRKPTVSRLSFPFVKSAKSPQSCKAGKAALCTPSNSDTTAPQSASCSDSISAKDDRGSSAISDLAGTQHHAYSHRGYSRQALAHIKWFWVTREEEWEAKLGPIRNNKPQLDVSLIETSLDDPLASFPASAEPRRKTFIHPLHQPQHELPPLTIHPRRGDLSTLRDPYCTNMDRSFAVLPTWTIGKTLWMYDVHLASHRRVRSDADPHDLSDASETESESDPLDTAALSTIFSDDSDATLVDSETESELLPGGSSAGFYPDRDLSGKHFVSQFSSAGSFSHGVSPGRALSDTTVISTSPYRSSWPQSAYSPPFTPSQIRQDQGGKVLDRRSPWAMDWHRRWEYMIEVLHRERPADDKS